jgi:lactoylglutathione lyase
MIRIKDPAKSLPFYESVLGTTLVMEKHFPQAKFSLYFMGSFEEGTELHDPKS